MEPPPRLYTYKGLFTESRSLDLTLKILSTILSFLIFLFLIAWRISRKHNNKSPIDKRLNFNNFNDLCQSGAFCLTSSFASRRSKFPLIRGYFNSREILLVEDWKVITLYDKFSLLNLHYSLAPKSFRRKWYGLMIADDTLQFRSELHELVLLAFNSLPIMMFAHIGQLGADPLLLGSILLNDCATFEERLDKWICNVYSEVFFFGPSEVFSETVSNNILSPDKEKFILNLRECVRSLELLHTQGYCAQKPNFFKTILQPFYFNTTLLCDTDEIIATVHNLINPLIHYYLDKLLCNEETGGSTNNPNNDLEYLQRRKMPTNLLLQLINTYHFLKEEGSPNEFLTLTHIIHLLSECCLLVRYTLSKTLKVLLTVLAIKPKWQNNVRRECKQFLDMQHNHQKIQKFASPYDHFPSHLCMSLEHTKCMVWTKAIIQETLRLCIPGWPFGCLRQALRDGQILEQDFDEGELVLFDEPSYYSDPELWSADEDTELTKNQPHRIFDPNRFIDQVPTTEDSRIAELSLPVHWARNILQRYAVCVPHKFTYLILTTTLVHLFGTDWESYLTDEQIEPDYSDGLLIWSNNLPKVDLRINY
ncbi:hypothetical protein MN116_004887 [Schistosoma mekongi]|uniref:Uncharacterized protein n=1 Tax=Schistosoma mekongi TaxID=38744 RepID=A0AAE2D616_SCHME|nr:hypothetical protein MN116_004887 [Schistosoma mekongi]